ncbi:DUF3667 domain-containing protein [Aureisphaera sp. CAU 1614]|uniref:DUF3667 domain-containing protein n=1 Tax=Halomarinibacterium sedimenti TaxID=2857106 RepID=A0A9X1JXK1_9FLAO|nr:DUF3667 domain-containing protein [Halomarinibacterium sedimenti]MBW2936647.1 DUF3667 domain-containing protein [Halomarinibacterium sedimenti]
MSNTLPEKQTGRKAAKYRGVKCLNCSHPLDLSDVYCSYCGQINSTKKLSLGDYIKEFFSSIVNYDSRLRYTLKDILFKPGTITKNYVGGQRLKYANPFRFFLSVSIIYFLLQSLITTFSSYNPFVNLNNDTPVVIKNDSVVTLGNLNIPNQEVIIHDSLDTKKENLISEEDTLDKEKRTLPIKPKEPKEITYYSEAELDSMSFSDRLGKRFSLYRDFYTEYDIANPARALDSLKHNNTQFNRWLYSKNSSIDRVKENPFGFANYMLGKIPFFLFFFAPFFALFLWLIYSKKKYSYMEHLIFIFHIFGFVFLGMLILLLPDLLIGDEILTGILFMIIGPIYFYKALRNFYMQNRFITIIKFLFLNIVFNVSVTIIAILFFAITAATY